MADLCCQYDYAGIQINDTTESTDRLVIDQRGSIVGLDGAPIRSQVDPRGQTHGGIVHPKLFAARIVTFTGWVDIRTVVDRQTAEYREALMTLQAAVIAALEAQLNTPATLAWTPEGQGAKSLSASYGTPGGEIKFEGPMIDCSFSFSLIAADPTISG